MQMWQALRWHLKQRNHFNYSAISTIRKTEIFALVDTSDKYNINNMSESRDVIRVLLC